MVDGEAAGRYLERRCGRTTRGEDDEDTMDLDVSGLESD
jgi:hypothetical protein